MKELSIKEKAKTYDELLAKAKQIYNNENDVLIMHTIEDLFPELKESEDERIRKELIALLQETLEHVGSSPNIWTVDNAKRWIAWLEKQWQGSKKVSIWKHWKNGIAGNGEGKPIYLIKTGNTYNLSSCLGFECDYIELSELDNLMLEKQVEQKPFDYENANIQQKDFAPKVEQNPAWSEEDERLQHCLIRDQEKCLEEVRNDKVGHSEIISDLKEMYRERIDWLKSLKNKVQPQLLPQQECEIEHIEHGKYYYCIKDYYSGGCKRASKGEVVQALRGMNMMALGAKANEYFIPVVGIKSAWSEEDEKMWLSAIEYVRTYPAHTNSVVDWLKSLKNKVQPQPKKEWSEEDKEAIEEAIIALEDMYDEDNPLSCYGGYGLPFDRAAERLKNIKNRFFL